MLRRGLMLLRGLMLPRGLMLLRGLMLSRGLMLLRGVESGGGGATDGHSLNFLILKTIHKQKHVLSLSTTKESCIAVFRVYQVAHIRDFGPSQSWIALLDTRVIAFPHLSMSQAVDKLLSIEDSRLIRRNRFSQDPPPLK